MSRAVRNNGLSVHLHFDLYAHDSKMNAPTNEKNTAALVTPKEIRETRDGFVARC